MKFLGLLLLILSFGCNHLISKTSAELKVLHADRITFDLENEVQRSVYGNNDYRKDEEVKDKIEYAQQKRMVFVFVEIVFFLTAVYFDCLMWVDSTQVFVY